MYTTEKSMGLGFLTPKTLIEQLKMKLYVGHTRSKSNTNDLLENLQEHLQFQSGLTQNIGSIHPGKKYWDFTWVDDVLNILHNRNMKYNCKWWPFTSIS